MMKLEPAAAVVTLLMAHGNAAFPQATQDPATADAATTRARQKQDRKAHKAQRRADKAGRQSIVYPITMS